MKSYRINELFYSLQGEGFHTGRAAVFIRFSGCNLACPFCDTDFSSYREMTADEIMAAIRGWRSCGFVVLTGGEPSLQADDVLIDALHEEGFYVAVETNGTHPLPQAVDWVTLSPKDSFVSRTAGQACHAPKLAVGRVDEVKVIFDGIHDPSPWETARARLSDRQVYLCLQPCDTGNEERNRLITRQCVEYIKCHPQWHLSLQTHKFIHIR